MSSLFELIVPSAQAAEYTIGANDVTAVGSAITDSAGSILGIFVQVLPLVIPMVAVFFLIRWARGFISGR